MVLLYTNVGHIGVIGELLVTIITVF